MLVVVLNVGKATGATTIAAGLAAATAASRPDARSCVVEADPRGGDLAVVHGLEPATGVLSLAATSEPDLQWDVIERHSHPVEATPGLRIMPIAITTRTNLEPQVTALWRDAGALLAGVDEVVIVDLGRYDGAAASLTPVWMADVVVAVCSGDAAGLARGALDLARAPFDDPQLRVIPVVNGSAWGRDEIQRTVGLDAWGVLEWNTKAARVVRSGHWHAARRSTLSRQLTVLADEVCRVPSRQDSPS